MSVDIEQLVKDHKKAIHTVDGIEIHSVPSLISQLRDALFAGIGDGGTKGHRSKLPLQAAALDLYQDLDEQITACWVLAFKRPPNADRIEQLLSEWAAWAQPDTRTTIRGRELNAAEAVLSWVQAIENYLNPPRTAEIQAPCVACGTRYVFRRVDGETIRSAALTFTRDRDTGETLGAGCAECGAKWSPSEFRWLVENLSG